MRTYVQAMLFRQSNQEAQYDCLRARGILPLEMRSRLQEIRDNSQTLDQESLVDKASTLLEDFQKNKTAGNFAEFYNAIYTVFITKLDTPFSNYAQVLISSLLQQLANQKMLGNVKTHLTEINSRETYHGTIDLTVNSKRR